MDLVENSIVNTQLPQNIVSMFADNRVFHAIIFEGNSKGQLREVALNFAGRLMCENNNGTMCGRCIHCKKTANNSHKDVVVLSSKNGDYTKDAIREMRLNVYKTPVEGRVKIYIFEEIEDMSEEVQNLLLKLIEEPPADTYFVMTSQNRYLLLSTVVSRVVAVNIEPISIEQCIDKLSVAFDNAEKVKETAILTNGNYDMATEILSDEKTEKKYLQCVSAVTNLCLGKKYDFLSNVYTFEKDRKTYNEAIKIMLLLVKNDVFMKRMNIKTKKLLKIYNVLNKALEYSSQSVQLQIISILIVEKSCEK